MSYMLIPLWFQFFWLFSLGSVIGSFLGVVSYRFHTGHSLGGSSHCESCANDLAWYELVPVVSYLVLRGRCHTCGSFITIRHFLIEILTGFLFMAAGFYIVDWRYLFLSLVLISVLIVIFAYDIKHMIIPDELIIVLSVLSLVLFAYQYYGNYTWAAVFWALAGAAVASGFYGLIWLLSGGKAMGFGDVKLALPLGFIVGPVGAFSMIIFSFWIGAVCSLLIMFWPSIKDVFKSLLRLLHLGYSNSLVEKKARYLTMKSEVPFAPFIAAAFLLTFLVKINVLELTNYVFTWFTKI